MQPVVNLTPIVRQSSDGNTNNEGIKNVELKQASVVFGKLPESLDDLKQIDRTGADGRYITMALIFCAFRTWRPEDQNTCNAMLEYLMNSPTCGMVFNNFGKQFVKDRMMQNNKYSFLANAYFDGAEPSNGYTPAEPFTVTVEDYVYNMPPSTMYGPTITIERLVTRFKGADNPRSLDLYMDPKDNSWYAWSDSYKGLMVDIKPKY